MIERLLGDEPTVPAAAHHIDIDLLVLTGILTAKPDRFIRTVQGLTGEEKLIAVELSGEGDHRRLRLVFDRAVVDPTYMQYDIPRATLP